MQVYDVPHNGEQEIKYLILNIFHEILGRFNIDILIGTTILQHLTEAMCQTKDKRVILEIIIGSLYIQRVFCLCITVYI